VWLVLVVLVLVVFFWYGSARSNEARRRDAGSFQYDDPDGYSVWIVNFVKGRLFYLWHPPDPDPADPNNDAEYEMRRVGPGNWEVRLTNESWARAVRHANADAKSESPTLYERATRELEALGHAPDWKPLFPDLATMVESRYQTYADVFDVRT
jgi:hypothetical protein